MHPPSHLHCGSQADVADRRPSGTIATACRRSPRTLPMSPMPRSISPTHGGAECHVDQPARQRVSPTGSLGSWKIHCPPGAPARPPARYDAPSSPRFPPPLRPLPATCCTISPSQPAIPGGPRRPGSRHASGTSHSPRGRRVPATNGLRISPSRRPLAHGSSVHASTSPAGGPQRRSGPRGHRSPPPLPCLSAASWGAQKRHLLLHFCTGGVCA